MILTDPSHIQVNYALPKELVARAKAVAKRTNGSLAQFCREALMEKVLVLEGQVRWEEEQKRLEKERARQKRREGIGSIAPVAPLPPIAEPEPLRDRTEAVYEDWAARILTAGDDHVVISKLIPDAILAVRRAAPLTSPRHDEEILRRLENVLLRMRDQAETARETTMRETPVLETFAASPTPSTPTTSAAKPLRTSDERVGQNINTQRVVTRNKIPENFDSEV